MIALIQRIRSKVDGMLVKSVDMTSFQIDFTERLPVEGEDLEKGAIRSAISAKTTTVVLPFRLPLVKMKASRFKGAVYYQDQHAQNIETIFSPTFLKGNVITTSIEGGYTDYFPSTQECYLNYIRCVIRDEKVVVHIKATADMIFDFGVLGVHTIKHVPFSSALTLFGLNSFPSVRWDGLREIPPLDKVVSNLSLSDSSTADPATTTDETISSTRCLTLSGSCFTKNTSNIAPIMGDVAFEMWIPKVMVATTPETSDSQPLPLSEMDRIGTVIWYNVKLAMGDNELRDSTMNFDTSLPASRQFLNNLAKNKQTVFLAATEMSSPIHVISHSVAGMRTSMEVPQFVCSLAEP
ncbi:hypothetical protein BGW38_000158 [Lunasporangiospora selenospora]|uniref:Uncharacterized protein n=1 Tax=Lunasporangiospora selenospora TaxID=979761 RepID=A0A9P6FVX5_9FUNG|nr:hypothetical protein BGW38_000158 [Lunasporangiospora selenospora]